MTKQSRTHQLIDQLLTEPLVDLARRMRGDGASWHGITVEVSSRTGVTVTPETLRIWLANEPDMDRGAKAGAA